jgi:6-phosphofructokinase 1
MKRIVVLSSGGDAPGMNAAIRATVRSALKLNIEVFGSYSGFQGIVEKSLKPMTTTSVANCIQHGGTILKTDRCDAFYEKQHRDACRLFLAEQKIDGLVVIGGDGSFRGAASLYLEGGPKVIGIPATIDNDINGTDYTIGFDTARNTALGAIDKIRDTASSHNRNFIVEVMGRNAGFLAVDVGIAGGAEYILIPEFEPDLNELAKKIKSKERQKLSSIMVVAESDRPGRSLELSEQLSVLTGRHYRVCILGHTQRGGAPSALDRKLASLMGVQAVNALLAGETNKMVALNQDQLGLVELPKVDLPSRKFTDIKLLEANTLIC